MATVGVEMGISCLSIARSRTAFGVWEPLGYLKHFKREGKDAVLWTRQKDSLQKQRINIRLDIAFAKSSRTPAAYLNVRKAF